MDDEDLRLNTLHRFAKHSPRLVLEEHGHCEVPAGCGGVVLRWRNPDAGLPVVFYGGFPGAATIYVDGATLHSSRADIAFGSHILVVRIVRRGPAENLPDVMAWATVPDLVGVNHDEPAADEHGLAGLCSAGDGTWRVTTAAVDPSSLQPVDLHGPDWHALAEVPLPDSLPDDLRWSYEGACRHGAAVLALPTTENALWVAKAFDIHRPRHEEA